MSTGVDLSQFYDMFFDEAEELLADMEQILLGVDVDQPDIDDLNAIFRAAHSIKGGAGTFGCFEHLATTTHILENVLDAIRKGELTLRQDMIDVFLDTKDVLSDQLAAYREGAEPDQEVYESTCQVLRTMLEQADGGQAQGAAQAVEATVTASEGESADSPAGNDGSGSSDRIANAVSGTSGTQVLRVTLKDLKPDDARALEAEMAIMGTVLHKQHQDNTLSLWVDTTESADDIAAVCCFIVNADQLDVRPEPVPGGTKPASSQPAEAAGETQGESGAAAPEAGASQTAADSAGAPAPSATDSQLAAAAAADTAVPAAKPANATPPARKAAKKTSAPVSSTLRVGVEKVDQIINLVGELVITQAMLVETAQSLDPVLHDRLINGIEQFERNARDLQEAVMSIRMMPMDYVFSRFPRVVRESAAAMNKQIRLVTHGQATELDKSLIERIIDPLTHLVRNSIDHGIELPEDRIKAGKEPEGVLTLSAQHSGGHIIIEVADDGAGLNRERILAKAISSGFPVNENTPDDELWQLIFAPGFSTADKVTAISGRGVGMDVVRRNIQGMGGHIHLSSTKGKGTITRIILPLTLAILDGMSVRVGEETFILPLSNVMESMQPTADQIKQISETERVLYVRGEYLPLVTLHEIFDVGGAETDVTRAITVILKAEEARFALQVDHLVGQHQVVVKNLEANYRKIPGISAATILGDGSVALIVDVFALMRMTQTHVGAMV